MRVHKGRGQLESDYFEREVRAMTLPKEAYHAFSCSHYSSQELPDSDISEDDLSEGDAPDADEVHALCGRSTV
jgi:hypothetical protein